MALPASGLLSISDIGAISASGSLGVNEGLPLSLDWLAGQILDTTPHSISDFYGEGADVDVDWASSGGTNITQTSQLVEQYNRVVLAGTASSSDQGRLYIRFNLSTSYTLRVYWKLNSVPTSASPGTLLTSGTQNTIWLIPATIGAGDNLYIMMYSSHPPGSSASWTNTIQSDVLIYGGLIDTFDAVGTTSWSGGG